MEVATGAMSPVLRKLGELLADEYNLEKRVKKRVNSLLTELGLMHAVLRKVGEVPSDRLEEEVRIWAGNVRELSYDMEDAVDDFLVRVHEGSNGEPMNMKNRVKKFIKKTTILFRKGKALHQISDAIQEVQELAKELAELRDRYQLDMRSTSNGATIDPRVISLYKDVGELVGIDHTRDELVKKLIGEDGSAKEQLKTISIVGVGGLGKTTLTKAVYEKIKAEFGCAALVHVGQNPDIKKVLKDLLYGLDKEKFKDIHNTSRDEKLLIEEIIEFLMDKRYLIVIDDIWEEKTWEYISCALPQNRLYSRVITTTRNVSVSEACLSSSDDMMHKMEPLSNEDSQILFHRRIFLGEEKCPQHLKIVSRDILKKCGGVPLAIITIASLLVSKHQTKQKDDWLNLLNSMGRGVTQGDILKDMKRILSLSYYDLPSHLKCCLLYLCIFPEDFEIVKDRLIWMWVGEGFIQPDKQEKRRLFEIGEDYFNELINRSLIQIAHVNWEGMVESCRVHDMVLDLICSLSSEENFVSILDNDEWHAPKQQRKARRLSLHNSKAKIHKDQFDSTILSKLRSFVVFPPAPSDWLPFLSSFQFIRVLDLSDCSSTSLKYIGNLIHLRYLRVRGNHVKELPMDIGKLQLLQTLDIRENSIEKLPASVVQLGHLICLYVGDHMSLPNGMGNLTSLEVLKEVMLQFSPRIVKEMRHLTEVRTLTIDWSGIDEDQINVLIKSLGKLHKLQHLKIQCGGKLIDLMREGWMPPPSLCSFESWGPGTDLFLRLPKWINSTWLPLLSSLAIDVEELCGEDLQIIGRLPALRFLALCAHHVTGKLDLGADAFPSARYCCFFGFPAPPCLFPTGAMPRLEHLRFEVSPRLIANTEVDCGMGHLPSLEEVVVYYIERGECKFSCEERDRARAALRGAAKAHPKCPTIKIRILTLPKLSCSLGKPSRPSRMSHH